MVYNPPEIKITEICILHCIKVSSTAIDFICDANKFDEICQLKCKHWRI